MHYRTLGNTDLRISAVTMGCWAIVGDSTWGPQDETDTQEALAAALDVGITCFDTAEVYGDGFSEEILGEAFRGQRDRVILATKASPSNHKPADLKRACEASLRRLRTDYIDLYQLHWPCREVRFEDTWEMMERLVQEGKVRVPGVSNFGPNDLTALLAVGQPASNQLCYSLLFRAIEYEIQPLCAERGVSILCYSPLMQGLLTGKFSHPDEVPEGRARTRHFRPDRPQSRHHDTGAEEETFAALRRVRAICEKAELPMADVALAWALAQRAVATVICGMRNAKQARENARAGDLSLDAEIIAQLTDATDALKQKLGSNADMWQTESRLS